MKLRYFAAAAAALFASSSALASTCVGNCGSTTPNGSITAPPAYGPGFSYVSTNGGLAGAGQIAGVGGTNGSQFTTDAFSANSGDSLNFYFNYVTADGSGQFSDYGFAELLDSASQHVAWLFSARTTPSGNTSPGFGLPANSSTLNPGSSAIIPGAPVFDALGGSSGSCYSTGCGYTGWINSDYTIADSGNYLLRFGVTNFGDTAVDSALAFAGVTVAGTEVPTPGSDVPEPASWALMLAGFGLTGAALRRRRPQVSFG